jgi:TATA-binding protein-associated factor
MCLICVDEDFGNSGMQNDISETLSATGEKKKTEGAQKQQHVFKALQYLRKLCNHPSTVLTSNHPQYPKVMEKLAKDKSSIHDIKHSPKLVALQQLLHDCGIGLEGTEATAASPHRVLVFCQLKEMLDLIEHDLFKKHMPNVTFMRMDGSVEASKRHDIVQTFNADPTIDVLLLTTTVGGLGLNLTGADTVIFGLFAGLIW